MDNMKKRLDELLNEFLIKNFDKYYDLDLYCHLRILREESEANYLESIKPTSLSEEEIYKARKTFLDLSITHYIIVHLDDIMDLNMDLNKKYLNAYSERVEADMTLDLTRNKINEAYKYKKTLNNLLGKDIEL